MQVSEKQDLASLLGSRIEEIRDAWLADLRNGGGARIDLLDDAEMEGATERICREVVAAAARGNISDIRAPEYRPLLDVLGTISRRFAQQGLSPSETATFIFSIKATLIRLLTRNDGQRTDELVDGILAVGRLFDALGLVTFETYAQAREELISAQHRELEEAARGLERRVAERTAELAASNAELEAFCYTVSHDLQAPLRGIVGYGQALLEDYGNLLPEEAQTYLSHAMSEARRMGALIDDLLSLSRVSRAPIERSMVDLSALAEQTVRRLREAEPERQVAVAVAPGLAARGDPRLLQVVLDNLVGNAWKFTGHTEDAQIAFSARETTGGTVFELTDNGVGFDMKYADKLFRAFSRLHRATEFAGNGIGLATVDRIVRRHGGCIRLASRPGAGTTVSFTLEPQYAAGRPPHDADR